METRPARESSPSEYQRADFLQNFAQIKRTTMAKKDRGTSGVKLPHSKPPSSHLYLFLSAANMHYLCGKLRERELYKFRRESPLMSKACSIRRVFHRRSWLFPAKCIDNLIEKFAGIMNFAYKRIYANGIFRSFFKNIAILFVKCRVNVILEIEMDKNK